MWTPTAGRFTNSVAKDAEFTDEWGANVRSSRVAAEDPQNDVAHAQGQKSSLALRTLHVKYDGELSH
jgi:hypothetical protein